MNEGARATCSLHHWPALPAIGLESLRLRVHCLEIVCLVTHWFPEVLFGRFLSASSDVPCDCVYNMPAQDIFPPRRWTPQRNLMPACSYCFQDFAQRSSFHEQHHYDFVVSLFHVAGRLADLANYTQRRPFKFGGLLFGRPVVDVSVDRWLIAADQFVDGANGGA